jgi:hypothetical protein
MSSIAYLVESEFSLRYTRVIDNPATLQKPKEGGIGEPAYNVCLGSIDSESPFLRIRVESCTLFIRHAAVCQAQPLACNEIRCY